jgi:hypothetical protein
MGKNRAKAEKMIADFETEMNEYSKKLGWSGVMMSKRFKKDIIPFARRQNISVEQAIDRLRAQIKKMVLRQKPSSVPLEMPTLH